MAITARGVPVNGSGTGAATISATVATAGSSGIVVVSAFDNNGTNIKTPTAIAGGGATWAKIGESTTGAFHVGVSIWKADGLAAGAASIVITGVAGQGYYANFSEYSPLAALDKTADAYTFGTAPSVGPSAVTVDAAELVIAAFAGDVANNGGATTATGYTALVDQNTAAPMLRAGYKITSSTGTQSASWGTLTAGDQYAAFIVTIKDGLTGPPITTQPTSVRTSAGQTANFTAAATGATSQKWQSNATGSWVDISGATSTSYTTPTLTAGTAYAVRIIFSDGANESISDPADVWTPAAKPAPWSAVRVGSDLLRSRLLLGSSVAALRVGEDILLGQAASGGGINAALSLTDATDTLTAAGSSTVAGALSLTDAADTLTATASSIVAATFSATDATDTLTAAASSIVAAALSLTDTDDIVTASGTVSSLGVSASLSLTDADDALTAAASSVVSAAFSAQDANDALTSAGSTSVAASLSATDTDDTLTAAGSSTVSASAALTDSSDALAATAIVSSSDVSASLSLTDENDTLASSATAEETQIITSGADRHINYPFRHQRQRATFERWDDDDTLTAQATVRDVVVVKKPAPVRIATAVMSFEGQDDDDQIMATGRAFPFMRLIRDTPAMRLRRQ